MNTLDAYTIGEQIDFSSIPKSLFFGFEQWLGPWYGTLLTVAEVTISSSLCLSPLIL